MTHKTVKYQLAYSSWKTFDHFVRWSNFLSLDPFSSSTDARVLVSLNDQWSISLNVISCTKNIVSKVSYYFLLDYQFYVTSLDIKIIYTLILETIKRGRYFYDRKVERIVIVRLQKNIT